MTSSGNMANAFRLDTREFDAAIAEYIQTTRRDICDIVNQRAYNVAVRAFDLTPPSGSAGKMGIAGAPTIYAEKQKIKAELYRKLADSLIRPKTGPNKGKLKQGRHKIRAKNFTFGVLIYQARRGRYGQPGLYGAEMEARSTGMIEARVRGVGYLKAVWLPILRGLHNIVRFKVWPKQRMDELARWPGSVGWGSVQPAQPGDNVFVLLRTSLRVRTSQDSKIGPLQQMVMQQAIDEEGAEMHRHVQEKLQETANKFNGR